MMYMQTLLVKAKVNNDVPISQDDEETTLNHLLEVEERGDLLRYLLLRGGRSKEYTNHIFWPYSMAGK